MSSSSIGATAPRWTGKWVILISDLCRSLITFRSLATSEVPYEANLSLLRRLVLHLFFVSDKKTMANLDSHSQKEPLSGLDLTTSDHRPKKLGRA